MGAETLRRLLLITAALAMGIGTFFIAPNPASAHQFDTNSYWTCGATRLTDNYFVGHSWPSAFGPGGSYVRYECLDYYFDGSHKTHHAALLWWNGEISHIGGGSGWHFCYLGEYCPPEP